MSLRSIATAAVLSLSIASSIATSGSLEVEVDIFGETLTQLGPADVTVWMSTDNTLDGGIVSSELSLHLIIDVADGETVNIVAYNDEGTMVDSTTMGDGVYEYVYDNPFSCQFRDTAGADMCVAGVSYVVSPNGSNPFTVDATYEFLVEKADGFDGGVYVWSDQ